MIEKIISEVHAINYKTLSFKGLLSGRLKIGVVSTGKYVMPYLLTDFIKENQGIELTMDVTNKMKVIESLSKGEIDFALVSILPDRLNIHEEIILDNELYFVANNKFKIDKQKLTKEELEKHALIFREEGSATRKVMEDYFEKKNIRAAKKIELTSNEAVKQAVIAGLGISIMPLIGIRSEIKNKKLKIIPSSGLPIKTKWRLIWLKNKSLSPVATSYINYLKENKNILVSNYF
jgi:DNA-binding transcriptional LysR family regulator